MYKAHLVLVTALGGNMKLKYRGSIIFESDNIELIENFKKDFAKSISTKPLQIIGQLNELSDIGQYLPINYGDVCDKDYFDKIRKYNPYFLTLLEDVCSAIFSEEYPAESFTYYIRNPKTGMYGVIINGYKYSHTKMSTLVRNELPLISDFEIC